MISERRSILLERCSTWDKKHTPERHLTPQEKSNASSVKDRLAALSKSTNSWESRVKKDVVPSKINPSARRNLLGKPPFHPGKENTANGGETPVSKMSLLLDLDSGLDSFFSKNVLLPSENGSSIELDLNSIQSTPILSTPKRILAKKGGGRRRMKNNLLSVIHTDGIHFEEDPRDHMEAVIIVDDEEPVAKSAREGLQSKENYNDVKNTLRTANTISPFPSIMLIQVRGEKKVDVRLVEPTRSSLHKTAVFIIVTPNRLLKIEGDDSNILERTKATQICISITTKSDLFCTARQLENVSAESSIVSRLLPESSSSKSHESIQSEEAYECIAARSNHIIRITDDYQIQSVCKGERPRYDVLQSRETLILDFGSEVYVWSGRNAKKTSSKYASEYAQQLLRKDGRGDWVLYRRIFQGVQDTLFASKFSDWKSGEEGVLLTASPRIPDYLSKTPAKNEAEEQAKRLADYLRNLEHPEPLTVIEDYSFLRDCRDLVTESLSQWKLHGENLISMDFSSILLNDQCYIIRWQYRIQLSGISRLKDGQLSEKDTGRERVAYFYWLGEKSTPKQQGLCALKLNEMDKDKRPHLRIAQGMESPLFLSLFKGKLIIRSGIVSSEPLYLVRGATQNEAYAVQVDPTAPLRSHAVYLCTKGDVALVAGCDCTSISVRNGLQIAEEMINSANIFNLKDDADMLHEVQGDSSSYTWITANGRSSLPRFYRIYESEGDELHIPQFNSSLCFSLPQSSLSDIILIDCGNVLWIWSDHSPSTFSLRVASHFWKGRKGKATVVLKYYEPDAFIALFPEWNEWVKKDDDEKSPPTPPRDLKLFLSERTQTFSIEALRERTELPEGLDLRNIEQYLSDEHFVQVFTMTKEEFSALPQWKQIRKRKEAGLF